MNDQLMNVIMNYAKLALACSGSIVAYFYMQKSTAEFVLKKMQTPKDISKVSMPPELKQKYNSVDIERIKSQKIKEIIVEFSNEMAKSFPPEALTNFYNNINNLNIKNNVGIFFIISAMGTYYCKKNELGCTKLSALYHELFHMASSFYDKERDIEFSGFKQLAHGLKGQAIGHGITEGYTELLTQRYFGKKHDLPKAYKFEVGIVEKLEQIVGSDEMKKLYLGANLK